MKLETALTLLDKPKHKQTALQRAQKLTEAAGTRVDSVSFVWAPLTDSKDLLSADELKQIRQRLTGDRKAWQTAEVTEAGLTGKQQTVWADDVAEWLMNDLAKNPRDLFVKSLHRRDDGGLSALDWELLHRLPTPLLLTSTRRKKASNRVLAAIDLQHDDRTHRRLNKSVLSAAATFAEAQNAELHCVSAIEMSDVLLDLDIINERSTKKRILQKAMPRLEALLENHPIAKTRRHFPVGKVSKVVTHVGRKINADLLVVGSCIHRVRDKMGFGNSAERIISRAACDVLVVHP